MADRFNILLVGHGRLGQLIAAAAPQAGATIAGTIDDTNAGDLADRARWRDVDVAIDASAPDAFVANLPALCALGCSLVVGTTGWQAHAGEVRRQIDAAGIGAVVSANFSVGATLMDALTERAAKLFAPQDLYGAFVHETHHAAKKDAPSGTALLLQGRARAGRLSAPDRRRLDARRLRARHPHGRLRRAGRDHHPDPHRPRSCHVRAWGPRRRALGARAPRVVYDARRAGGLSYGHERLSRGAAPRSSPRSRATAPSTSPRLRASPGARSRRGCTSSSPAAPPARARRSTRANGAASSSSSSRPRPAACR